MENIILILILSLITFSIVAYLLRAKKRGDTCIGCPHGKLCAGKCSGGCSCESGQTGK